MGRHESLLASPLVLPSHHSEAHPLDCHRSSFLFCFPTPLVSPFSPFSFPSSAPFTAAFIAAPIAQSSRALICAPALFNRLAEELRLTSSTCLSHPFSTSLSTCCTFIFPSDCCFLPGIFFFFHSLLLAYFSLVLDVFLSTRSLSLCQSDLLYPSIPAKGGLRGPIKLPSLMSLPTLHSLGPTGQFIWSKGRQGASTR